MEEISDAESTDSGETFQYEGGSAAGHTEIEATSAAAESTESGDRTHWPKNSIFRAPAHIRYGREYYFEPKLVSIGPYYHGRQNLKRMEDFKLRCIKELRRKQAYRVRRHPQSLEADIPYCRNRSIYNVPVEPYTQGERGIDDLPLEKFWDSGSKARAFYKEEFDHSDVEFVRMLVIDSCFIIRIILSLSQQVNESMAFLDVHIKDVRSDLLLLENQIPLFFIREVYEWLFPRMDNPKVPPFETVLDPFIFLDMPWRINHGAMMCSIAAAHLLDLYWRCSLSPQMYMKLFKRQLKDLVEQNRRYISELVPRYFHELLRDLSEQNRGCLSKLVRRYHHERERDLFEQNRGYLSELLLRLRLALEGDFCELDSSKLERDLSEQEQRSWAEIHLSNNAPMVIANATELQKMAGIKFEKFKDKAHLDIIFSKGIMRMPRLKIDSRQITLLRNLVAFENCILPSMRSITCYMKLMDALIDSEKDVKLLQKCGVIYNTLSSHKMAATFFNDIGDFCFTDDNANPFSGLYKDVEKYYELSWHRRWASLRQNYFSSPWAVISVVAGVILLILSALQTFYTIYGYYHQKNGSPGSN